MPSPKKSLTMLHIENFGREHRNEMDIFTPSAALWAKIDSRINQPALDVKLDNLILQLGAVLNKESCTHV